MSTKHTPLTDAWERFRESEQCADAQLWAEHKHHIVGSFHIAFSAGWEAAYAQPPHKAASDLLEALERASRKLSAYVGVCAGDKELTDTVLPMARAAIAKAKGEIKPTKPSIDWSHVDKRYNWLAKNDDGNAFLYDRVPWSQGYAFVGWAGSYVRADVFSSYQPGTCDWRDSLIVRPGYEERES